MTSSNAHSAPTASRSLVNRNTSGASSSNMRSNVRGTFIKLDSNSNAVVKLPPASNTTSAYILLIVISIHSLFEGVAVGTAETHLRAVVTATILAAHKFPEAVVLAMAFIRSGAVPKTATPLLLMYAASTPVGVTVGALLSNYNMHSIEGPLTCVAAGSLLYVSCCDVIPQEFNTNHSNRITDTYTGPVAGTCTGITHQQQYSSVPLNDRCMGRARVQKSMNDLSYHTGTYTGGHNTALCMSADCTVGASPAASSSYFRNLMNLLFGDVTLSTDATHVLAFTSGVLLVSVLTKLESVVDYFL
eukprot:Lankesteria_metandrocarpae@DN104_c0_g1_i1.p1